jgi:cytochrome c peroxidase
VANFSLYWGLAIQAYEATLISNDSRLDQFLEGNTQALTTLEQQGMREFLGGGSQCTQCHQGAEFTGASFSNTRRPGFNPANPRDAGFFRTAVTPIEDDPGFGNGAFKSPGLRNVEFTGPYFHDGGQATLEQVMDFYARNGDFRAGGNLGPGIGQIRLNPQERTAVVAFMKALTDDRVRYQRAPFDHPSLCIPTGHEEAAEGILAADTTDGRFASSALDRWALIPAVGRNGDTAPLQTFDELLRGIGNDGSRAHNLTQACAP